VAVFKNGLGLARACFGSNTAFYGDDPFAPLFSHFLFNASSGAHKPPDDCLDNGEHFNTQEGTTFASKQLTIQGG